jgi:hypothetical protein
VVSLARSPAPSLRRESQQDPAVSVERGVPTIRPPSGGRGGVRVSNPPDRFVQRRHESQSGVVRKDGGDHIRSDPVFGIAVDVADLDLKTSPMPNEADDLTVGHATLLDSLASPARTAVGHWDAQ